jgi:hypothetical protein
LSARCGLCRGASSMGRDRLDSMDGRPEPGREAPPTPTPAGMGALICRGALMAGAFFFLSPFFLRREMPLVRSDILPARSVYRAL